MTRPLDAALELHEFLTSNGILYAIIGGLAVQQWGAPRLTQDLDLTVSVPLGEGKALSTTIIEAVAHV